MKNEIDVEYTENKTKSKKQNLKKQLSTALKHNININININIKQNIINLKTKIQDKTKMHCKQSKAKCIKKTKRKPIRTRIVDFCCMFNFFYKLI